MTLGAGGDGRQLYVYFTLPFDRLSGAIAIVHEMQGALVRRHPGLRARLLRRPEEANGLCTLMEVYDRVPGGVDAVLQAAIEAEAMTRLAAWLDGPRHVEVFLPCA